MTKNEKASGIRFFEKYLTLWVIICMIIGILIGVYLPIIPDFLSTFEYANVSIPIALLIWLMIYPMMLKINFKSIKQVGENPKGLVITWVTNWLIKPFSMYAIGLFFFNVVFKNIISPELATEYLAGAVILGAAPCTAMVFVWSHLTKGDPAYTLVQVATNDLIILVGFIPIVGLLLGMSSISIPWNTLFLSIILFVIVPLLAGVVSRIAITKNKGIAYFEKTFIPKFNNITTVGLLLTLIIIFSFQGQRIIDNPVNFLLIAIPLIIQTFLVFFIPYLWAKVWNLPHNIAAPAGLIGASNFFELAVAVAISLFGLDSGAALATVVGVLVEVPVMLQLVKIANKTQGWFSDPNAVKQ